MRVYNEYMEVINKEQLLIDKYNETGNEAKLESSIIDVIETSIYLPSSPVAPSEKTSPRNAVNVAIGAVLGGMLGCMIVLIKEYWFKET